MISIAVGAATARRRHPPDSPTQAFMPGQFLTFRIFALEIDGQKLLLHQVHRAADRRQSRYLPPSRGQ
jgi:hypothetical protein